MLPRAVLSGTGKENVLLYEEYVSEGFYNLSLYTAPNLREEVNTYEILLFQLFVIPPCSPPITTVNYEIKNIIAKWVARMVERKERLIN